MCIRDRCISLLKILFTNECIYDCKYCINRGTNDVERVTFTPEEVCNPVSYTHLDVYKRQMQRYASKRLSKEERRVDALALRAEERRDKLRKACLLYTSRRLYLELSTRMT